jgi:hypothetical protein
MPHHLKATHRCHGAIDFVDRIDGILCFAVWHEVETRSASEWFDVGNAKKYEKPIFIVGLLFSFRDLAI